MRTQLPILAALLLACQSPPPRAGEGEGAGEPMAERGSAEPKPSSTGPTCEAAPLTQELEGMCAYDLGVPPIALPRVEWSAETYHPLATRVISLDTDGLRDPEGGNEAVTIQAWLADPPRRLPEPGEMVFAIAAEVPATTVAELLRGLSDAGRKEIRVLVHAGDDQPVPQPRDPKLLDRMGDDLPADPNQRVVFVAQAVQGYAEKCPPIAGVFKQLAQVSPGDRCSKFAELAAAAIVECGCVELPTIMTFLYALTMGFEPPSGRAIAVPVQLDPEAARKVAAGASWGDVAGGELRSTELHRLWIDAEASP